VQERSFGVTALEDITEEAVFGAYPNVLIDRDNIEHYRGLLAQKLMFNRCVDCGYWIYPHRPLCPECTSFNVKASELSGLGKIYMFTLLYQERDPQSRLNHPITAAAIELADQPGLRYLAKVVNIDPDQIVEDMPVRLTWIEHNGHPAPAFEPVTRQEA
jgi:uncharacterized protein